jgi:hypothetical protein
MDFRTGANRFQVPKYQPSCWDDCRQQSSAGGEADEGSEGIFVKLPNWQRRVPRMSRGNQIWGCPKGWWALIACEGARTPPAA